MKETMVDAPGHAFKRLEIVLKCDSAGSEEAVRGSVSAIGKPGPDLKVIHSGVGSISKSDLLMALTGSRLVVGFNVDTMPKIVEMAQGQGIEIRLYDVIYRLTEDMRNIAETLIPMEEKEERILGKAKVVALFKSSRRGIILGCEILEGAFALEKNFRVISAMGPVYAGKVESLHVEEDAVKEASSVLSVSSSFSE